jgi:hypothetical protein
MKAFLIAIFFGGFLCSGLAQLPGSPSTTNHLTVSLWVPHAKNPCQAPANIFIQGYVRLNEPGLQKGDVVNVQFFADDKLLGSGKAVWHDMIRPHSPPGTAVPMVIISAGFNPAHWIWTNAPAGSHSLAAEATWTNALSGASAPVTITVLPAKSP